MFNLGFSEIILLAIIALVFIGPKQLPELARSLGRTLNELKRATGDLKSTFTNVDLYEPEKPHPPEIDHDKPIDAVSLDSAEKKNDEQT